MEGITHMNMPIITIDVHGMRTEQAICKIKQTIDAAGPGVYTIRIIHGYNGGTKIRMAIREEFSYGREPKVKRIQMGDNEGITELVLKELF